MSESIFALSFKRYAAHLRNLGYKPEEVTLMMIGYAAGWSEYDQALDRVAADAKKTKR